MFAETHLQASRGCDINLVADGRLEGISADILAIEKETEGLLDEIMGGRKA